VLTSGGAADYYGQWYLLKLAVISHTVTATADKKAQEYVTSIYKIHEMKVAYISIFVDTCTDRKMQFEKMHI